MKSWKKQPAALLLLLLIGSGLALTVLGLGLKYTIGRNSPQIQDTLAIAVPFVLLRGDIKLEPNDTDQPPATEPDAPPEGDEPTTPILPSETLPTIGPNPAEEDLPSAPVFTVVEESYFDKALFIGDSRTVGLANYGRLGQADYFADVGMSVFNLFDKTISDKNFSNQTLRGLLQSKSYETIYLMLGINEIGYPTASLEKKMTAIVEELTTLAPNATLILQANLAVTQNKATKNELFALDKIKALNDMIASHADGKKIFYLDVNPYFADENGYFRADATGDGVHPYAAEYKNWAVWLKEHAVVKAKP